MATMTNVIATLIPARAPVERSPDDLEDGSGVGVGEVVGDGAIGFVSDSCEHCDNRFRKSTLRRHLECRI